MSLQKLFQLLAIVILVGLTVVNVSRGAAGAETQDPAGLDRRISMLEQRFYTLETGMNRLQQSVSSQRSSGSPSDMRSQEVDQLRQEVQRLQLRLNEVECGLLKLDERTSSASGNRKSGDSRPADPCRLSPGTPLRLTSRP